MYIYTHTGPAQCKEQPSQKRAGTVQASLRLFFPTGPPQAFHSFAVIHLWPHQYWTRLKWVKDQKIFVSEIPAPPSHRFGVSFTSITSSHYRSTRDPFESKSQITGVNQPSMFQFLFMQLELVLLCLYFRQLCAALCLWADQSENLACIPLLK